MRGFIKPLFTFGALALFMAVTSASARAADVTFSTTGSFNGGAFSSPNSITFGGGPNQLTLTFTGITNSTVNTGAGFIIGHRFRRGDWCRHDFLHSHTAISSYTRQRRFRRYFLGDNFAEQQHQ